MWEGGRGQLNNSKESAMKNLGLSLIVTMTPEGIIGQDDLFLWKKIPSSLRRTQEITRRIHLVVMGNNTRNMILTKQCTLVNGLHHIILTKEHPLPKTRSQQSVTSIEETCAIVKTNGGHAVVIGGAATFELFFPLVNTLFVTMVYPSKEKPIVGNKYFPNIEKEDWRWENAFKPRIWDPQDDYATSFSRLERKIKV